MGEANYNYVTFFVPGVPMAKARPRMTTVNGHPRAYTPPKTVNYERAVGLVASQAMGGRKPLQGPLTVKIVAAMPIPKSWSKKRRRLALEDKIRHTKKPDGTNIAKAIEDGANSIAWTDDSYICSETWEKHYSESPGVTVTAWIIGGDIAP